jgi:UDP-glucose 4-epimerase
MRIAVTGGAGYIGSTIIKNILSKGHQVVSIDNLSIGDYRYLKALKTNNLKLLEGDIRDAKTLDEAFIGVDAVAHLAAIAGLVSCDNDPETAISVNIFGTHQVLERAKKNKISRIVFCSSAAVYGIPVKIPVSEEHRLRPLNLYGITKLTGEGQMEVYHDCHGMETVNLRFGNVYGVGLYSHWSTVIPKFVKLGLEGNPLTVYGDGGSSRDFVHVEDISQALELALTIKGIGGETFNVGSEPATIGDIAKLVTEEIYRLTGKEVETIKMPFRLGETKEFSYDFKKIRRTLGFKPSWTLRKGVKQLIEFNLK